MSSDTSMTYGQRYELLARKLETCIDVAKLDTADEKEAWTLAHDILDLDEAFKELTSGLFRRLESAELSSDEINDVLLEIGEQLRHIRYHIDDSRYFAYLRGE